ncbi:Protein of unknown function [Gryllus bimaculatus]|nr:Protein of unknown function [Gryllus bimaculatus]
MFIINTSFNINIFGRNNYVVILLKDNLTILRIKLIIIINVMCWKYSGIKLNLMKVCICIRKLILFVVCPYPCSSEILEVSVIIEMFRIEKTEMIIKYFPEYTFCFQAIFSGGSELKFTSILILTPMLFYNRNYLHEILPSWTSKHGNLKKWRERETDRQTDRQKKILDNLLNISKLVDGVLKGIIILYLLILSENHLNLIYFKARMRVRPILHLYEISFIENDNESIEGLR